MKKDSFKYKLIVVLEIIGFALTLYLLYIGDKYLREKDTVPMTEEEKESVEHDCPRGVPPRFWN